MTDYIHYIEETLHIRGETFEYARTGDLPLYLKNSYTLRCLKLMGTECLLAEPNEPQNLAAMRKHCSQLMKLSGMECVLCLKKVNAYTKQKMIEESIPFVTPGKQLYLPFLAIALTEHNERDIQPADKISFMTQKLLLTAIYRRQGEMTLTEAAAALGVSKMTATRCFDELEAMEPSLIAKSGKSRRFIWPGEPRALWELILPILRNPIRKEYRLAEPMPGGDTRLGGMSAICRYSMLADNDYTTYAVSKEAAKELRPDIRPCVPKGEIPVTVVQVMQYELNYPDERAVDPLTAVLSLPDAELSDPRVEAAVEEILEEYLHG